MTLHTAADPLVVVQNETLLRDASGSTDELVQLFTVAPDTYPPTPGAPYGAGHCEFTPESRVGMIGLLDRWVRGGQQPGRRCRAQGVRPGLGLRSDLPAGPLAAAAVAGTETRPGVSAAGSTRGCGYPLSTSSGPPGTWHPTIRVPGRCAPRRGLHPPQVRSFQSGHSGSTILSMLNPAATSAAT